MLTALYKHILYSSIEIIPIFLVIWVVTKVMFRSSPNTKYCLWSIIVIRLTIPFQYIIPLSDIFQSKTTSAIENLSTTGLELLAATDIIEHAKVTSSAISSVNFQTILMITGLSILCGILICKWWLLKNLSSKSFANRDQRLDITLAELCREIIPKRKIQLCVVDIARIHSPAVTGIIKPKIFLPLQLVEKLNKEELRAILIHEIFHIKRYDTLFSFFQLFIQIMYFFHPLVWFANSKIRRLREEVCDDISVEYYGGDPKKYSNCLYNVLKMIKNERFSFSIGFSEKGKGLSERLVRLLDDNYKSFTRLHPVTVFLLIMLGVGSLGISCDNMVVNDQEDQELQAKKITLEQCKGRFNSETGGGRIV